MISLFLSFLFLIITISWSCYSLTQIIKFKKISFIEIQIGFKFSRIKNPWKSCRFLSIKQEIQTLCNWFRSMFRIVVFGMSKIRITFAILVVSRRSRCPLIHVRAKREFIDSMKNFSERAVFHDETVQDFRFSIRNFPRFSW